MPHIIAIGVLFWTATEIWNWASRNALLLVLFFFGSVITVIVIARYGIAEQTKRLEATLRKTRGIASKHARTLAVKRRQLISHDDYGNLNFDKWHKHVDYFIDTMVLADSRADIHLRSNLRHQVESIVNAYEAEFPLENTADIHNGVEYELLCKSILESVGWNVRTTPASGDQGADLIAEKAHVTVVAQCKFHNKPVGNKAVQEAFAAQKFFGTDKAVVVSNAPYTKAASQLAKTNGVQLLHHEDLRSFG